MKVLERIISESNQVRKLNEALYGLKKQDAGLKYLNKI